MRRAVLVVALAGCGDVQPFYCANDAECTDGTSAGTCTSFGFCAFPDTSCPSGKRYHDSAGNLANSCVGQEMTVAGDKPDGALPLEPFKMLDITGATDDYQPSCGGHGGRDIFFQTTIGSRSRLYLDTYGISYRPVLAIHHGPCVALGAEVACVGASCSDKLKQWSDILDPGTYCIIVDQVDGSETSTALVLRSMMGPPAPLGQVGTTVGDSCTADAWQGTCSPMGVTEQTWFYMTCAKTTFMATTCNSAPGFDGDLQMWGINRTQLACENGCPGPTTAQTDPGPLWLAAEAGATCGPIGVDVSAM